MYNTFEFVGKIVPCKETEGFKPYNTVKFNSGWSKKSIKFNVICGNNKHMLDVSDLVSPDLKNANIMTFSKATQDSDGNKAKGEKLTIPFADRMKPENIEKVAEFKKFVVDTEVSGRRFQLEKAIDKFKDGSIDDDQMNNLDVHSIKECEKSLAESKTKKHEFISAYDFIDYLNKFVNAEKIKNMVFKITGDFELSYNDQKDIWYRNFVPKRIYRVADDAEQISTGVFSVIFDKNAIDDLDFAETKKLHINGYLKQYLNNYKKDCFCPMLFTINSNSDEKSEKKAMGLKKKFTFSDECECEFREIGIITDILNGSQKVELTKDLLTEEQLENIEFGLCTLEDIKREMGKDIYGDKVTDVVVTGLARGFSSGSRDTAYTSKDVSKPRIESAEVNLDEDIFDEDEI